MDDQELREVIGKAIYEAEKHERLNLSMRGTIIEWETMREWQKDTWRKRAEVAIQAYLAELGVNWIPT